MALRRLRAREAELLVVEDAGGALCGCLTRSMLLERASRLSSDLDAVRVGDVLAGTAASCEIDSSAAQARRRIATEGLECLAVVREGGVCGVLTREDLLAEQLSGQAACRRVSEDLLELTCRLVKTPPSQAASVLLPEIVHLSGAQRGLLWQRGPDGRGLTLCRAGCPLAEDRLPESLQAAAGTPAAGGRPPCCREGGAAGERMEWIEPAPSASAGPTRRAVLCVCSTGAERRGEDVRDYLFRAVDRTLREGGFWRLARQAAEPAPTQERRESILDRGALLRAVDEALEDCRRRDRTLSVARIRAEFRPGRPDDEPQRFAERLEYVCRSGDVLLRAGACEHVLILPGAALGEAAATLRRIADSLCATAQDPAEALELRWGLAETCETQSEGAEALLELAARRLGFSATSGGGDGRLGSTAGGLQPAGCICSSRR
jgi:hypothetical protein